MSAAEMVQVNAARFAKLEEMERKAQLSARRASTKTAILAEKAKKAGITVSKEEIDNKIAGQDARKAAEAAPETGAGAAPATVAEVALVSGDDAVVDEEEAEAA